MATGNQSFSGTTGDDVFIGAAGVDTVTTNIGTDIILTSAGNDVITIDGVGNKTIDGGAGTDSIAINLSGYDSITDFTVSETSGVFTFTDGSSNAITLSNIETYSINSTNYTLWTKTGVRPSENTFWSSSEKLLFGFEGASFSASHFSNAYGDGDVSGLALSDNLTFTGNSGIQGLNLNWDRGSESGNYTGSWTIALGDGADYINSAKLKNSDSVDMGAGNDVVYIMISAENGTPTFANLDLAKLDGGTGTDTLSFAESGDSGSAEINLSSGGAVNFENLIGNGNAQVVRGNTGDNIISGGGGADTIYGGSGNDTLYADSAASNDPNDQDTDNDNLYGEAGNDTLIASKGDNILDGGTGADTITTGSGSDTIVLRVGDGGSTLAAADTITDFTDGTDVLGLDDGLQYTDLTIAQGTGSNSNDTIISAGSEYLAILTGISASSLTEADFTPVDIA